MANTQRDDKGCYIIEIDGHTVPFDFSMSTIHNYIGRKGLANLPLLDIMNKIISNPNYGDTMDLYKMALDSAWIRHSLKTNETPKPTEVQLSDYFYLIYMSLVDSVSVFFKKNGIDTTPSSTDESEKKI